MNKQPTIAIFALIFLGMLTLIGCAANKRLVEPLPVTFLSDVDTTKRIEKLPFDHSWVWANVKHGDYHGIYIAPVKIDTLDGDAWMRSASPIITSKNDYITEARGIADYFRTKLVEDFKTSENKRLPLVNRPGPGTVTLNIALTELEFSHPVNRAAALAAPVPGAGAALSAVSDPHAAFAARITDGGTGKLLATIADRKFAPMRIVDFNKLTVTSSPREIVGLWSNMLTKTLATGGKEEVEKEGRFALLPW